MENPNIQLIKRLDKFALSFSGICSSEEMILAFKNILEASFQVEYTCLYLSDLQNNLKLVYSKGFNDDEKLELEKSAMGRYPGEVYQSKKIISISDRLTEGCDPDLSLLPSDMFRSFLYIPLLNGDQAIGALGIIHPRPNVYSEEEIAILTFICNLAGALFGKIQYQKLLKSANEEIQILSKLPSESPAPIIKIDKDKTILYANKASNQILAELGLNVGDRISPDFFAGLAESLEKGQPVEQEISINEIVYSFIFTPIVGTGYFNLYGKDITFRRNLENELKRMALIARETGNSVLITNNSGEIEWVNDAFTQLTGYQLVEVKGEIPGRFLQGEETDPETIAMLAKAISSQSPVEVDIINYTKSHKKYWVKIQLQPVFNAEGRLENFISIQKEITKEKNTEQELIKTTAFQKTILNSAAIAIISTDLQGIIQSFNPAASRMFGYSPEEVIGLKTPMLFHDENEVLSLLKKNPVRNLCYFGHGKITHSNNLQDTPGDNNEFACINRDGNRFPVSLTITALQSENGMISGYLGMAEDISQRKEHDNALQLANLRFRSLISRIQAGVMVENEERNVVLVNQYFCNLFSIPVPPEMLIGSNCADSAQVVKDLFENSDAFIKDIDHTLALRQIVTDHELQMKNGTSLQRDYVPIEDFDKKNFGILWIYRDVTKRKKTEKDLIRQSQILHGTAQAMNYLLTLPDYNEAIRKALEAIGIAAGVDRVYIFQNEEDQTTRESFFSQKFEWSAPGIAPQIDNPELQNMPYTASFPRWYDLLSSGNTISGLTKDFPENERRILESEDIKSIIAAPIFVSDQLWGLVGFDDCTVGIEWSSNEIAILKALAGSIGGSISRMMIEKELIHSRQIAEYATNTKSEFLATMSHEIRTPMHGVIGMTSLLLKTQLTSDQRDYAETIRLSGELLLNLINDIFDFSKIESGKMVLEEQDFDLRSAIEEVLDLLAIPAHEKRLGLYFYVDPAIPKKIKGDLTRLRQILVNLTGNAIKFTTVGEVVINARLLEKKNDISVIEFSVKDTGMGIPQEKLDLLFKPFSQIDASTTRKYGGTGLGLAICVKLVNLMNGTINVKSEVNRGSDFIFTIKTVNQPESEPSKLLLPETSVFRGKKILIVDENATNLEILNKLLLNLNVKTLIANSALNCLNIIGQIKDIDLFIIDNDISHIGSSQLVAAIKRIKEYTDSPIILISFAEVKENRTDKIINSIVRINKPLKHSQLITCISNFFSENKLGKFQNVIQPPQIQKLNEVYPLNILVAEDNAINQKLITRLFEMLGYDIQIAVNGFETINTLNRMPIDIIFMDVQMPEMDGIEATKQIISRWGNKKPLIVAMTANALQNDKEKCLEAGMDDYISKPLTIDQVSKGIGKWALMCHKSGQV